MLRLIVILTTLVFLISLQNLATSQSNVRRVTNTPEQFSSLNPTLSDDGKVVAFETSADLANTGATSFQAIKSRLPSGDFESLGPTRMVSPSLSAHGEEIAFASSEDLVAENPDRNSEIFLFSNNELRQITNTQPATASARLRDGNHSPSLSLDGRFLVFVSNRDISGTNSDFNERIILFDTQQGTFQQLTSTVAPARISALKLSGDGRKIYFARTHEAGSDILIFDRTTGTSHVALQKIDHLSITTGRAVSNDGTRLVYAAQIDEGSSQVFLFNLRSNSTRQLTQLGVRASDVELQPTISGDGKRVAFATRRRVINASDGSVELYVYDLPTGTIEQVTNAPAAATGQVNTSLNFDGSSVVFSFPRSLSGPTNDDSFANTSEIYLATTSTRPAFGEARIANAADQDFGTTAPPIARGSIATIKGKSLAYTSRASISPELPLSLEGTSVTISGVAARLFHVSPGEVTFVVPDNLPLGPHEFVVTNPDGFSSKAAASIANTAPGVFRNGDSGVEAVVLNADSLVAGPFDPTDGRLRLSVFATGVRHAANVSAQINGRSFPVELVAAASVLGLDEVHLLLDPELRGDGMSTLRIRAEDNESNEVSFVIGGNHLRDLMINEFLADPPDGPAGDANRDGVRSSSDDEFLELVNPQESDLDLGNWTIRTRAGTAANEIVRHRFSARTIVAAGSAIVVFGGGSPSEHFGAALIDKASTGSLSLSNTAGTILVYNSVGALVTSVNYGPGTNRSAAQNQSLTRSPDLSGHFAQHSMTADSNGALFSPGSRINGESFVVARPLASILVLPPATTLTVGETLRLEARALDSNGKALPGVIFTWTSDNPSIAPVDQNGVITAMAAGSVLIRASARNVTSNASQIQILTPAPSATPTPTPTATPTPTPSPTSSPTPLPSPSPNPIPTPTPSPSPTPTPTPLPSPSPTPTPTPTPLPTPSPGPTPTPTPTPTPEPSILISELRTRGPNGASDEFIELVNNSDSPINLSGWKIKGSSSGGTVTTRLTISNGTIIPPRGHFLATNSSGYSEPVPGDQTFTSGVANDGGVAITTPNDIIVDQVGLSAGSAFREGDHLTPLTIDANQSYERKRGAATFDDTGNNAADFLLRTPSDPHNLAGAGPVPTPTPTPVPSPTPSPSPSPTTSSVVISQIYGGGGNSGAPFQNDFIELFNRGVEPVTLTGWSVQYSGATSSTWAVTNLTGMTLQPGQRYLIREAGGANGSPLPVPDATGTIAMAATSGKVALVKSTTTLTGACPSNPDIVDLVGYGSSVNCFSGTPAPAPSNTLALQRKNDGCTDSQANGADFATGIANPRNTQSAIAICGVSAGSLIHRDTMDPTDPALPHSVLPVHPEWCVGLFSKGSLFFSFNHGGNRPNTEPGATRSPASILWLH